MHSGPVQARRVRLAGLLAALMLGLARPAEGADAIPLADAISVDGPECVDRNALVADLAVWLGRDTIDSRVRIVVHNEQTHFVAFEISRDGRPVGDRRLGAEGMDCAKLRAVAGLALASALDATLLATLASASPAPPPPPEPTPPARPVSPPAAERNRLSVAADAALLIGVLPSVVPGGELNVGYRVSSWFEPRVAFLGTGVESFALGTASTHASLFLGRAEACLVRETSVFRGRACAGVAAGAIPAAGSGLAPNYAVARGWAAASARLEGELRLAPILGIVLGADGLVPFVAPSFEAVGTNGVTAAERDIPRVGLVLRGGLVLAFL
jgi:hypothetical protein